jgi:hypothetical protein
VECKERQRLTGIYLDALVRYTEAAAGAATKDSKVQTSHRNWREATKDARAARDEALRALEAHRKEHGC